MLKNKNRIEKLEEQVKALTEQYKFLSSFVLDLQAQIKELKKEEKKPTYFN